MNNEIQSLYLTPFHWPHRKNRLATLISCLLALSHGIFVIRISVSRFGVAFSQKWQIIFIGSNAKTHEEKKHPIKTSVNAGAINASLCNFQVIVAAEAWISVFGMSSRIYFFRTHTLEKTIPKHSVFQKKLLQKSNGWSMYFFLFMWNLRIEVYVQVKRCFSLVSLTRNFSLPVSSSFVYSTLNKRHLYSTEEKAWIKCCWIASKCDRFGLKKNQIITQAVAHVRMTIIFCVYRITWKIACTQ